MKNLTIEPCYTIDGVVYSYFIKGDNKLGVSCLAFRSNGWTFVDGDGDAFTSNNLRQIADKLDEISALGLPKEDNYYGF